MTVPGSASNPTASRRRAALRRRIQTGRFRIPRHRVLVVAAEPWQRLALVNELVDGCEVLAVSDCASALRSLADPTLVCTVVAHLDLGEGPDGIALMDAARAQAPHAAIVLITDPPRTGDQAARFVRARRAHQMLITPWNDGDVIASVCAACDGCSHRDVGRITGSL